MKRAYGNGPVLTEFGGLAQLLRTRSDLASLYAMEGTRACINVLGVGCFAFLPYQDAALLSGIKPSCWVGTIAEALAGLDIISARFVSGESPRLGGGDHV
jgi:hypothetical protein